MLKDKLISVARGFEEADLVIKNAKIINVFTKTIEEGDIAISDGMIVGIGVYKGKEEIDLKGSYISPGFIDGHVHIESSMLTPSFYGEITLPRGTTSIVADCHEIANVLGTHGIDYMLESSEKSLQDVFMMIPSCVPSSIYESNGAILKASDIKKYINHPMVKGLGEMMDYPGAIKAHPEVIKKIDMFSNLTIDGHAPDLSGNDLNAYVLSGVQTDHECTRPEELIEKVKRGMYIHLREGSQTKNVLDLLPGLNPNYYQRILFCSDDLHPNDIINRGHIDYAINLAIESGLDPIQAISMATINIAQCYKLDRLGAIAPGYYADLVTFKDLGHIDVDRVYKKGQLIAKNKKPLFKVEQYISDKVIDTVHIDVDKINLDIKLKSDNVYVIGLVENNIITKKLTQRIVLEDQLFHPRNNNDLLKLAVIERHHLTGNIGFGIVKAYGLKNGALAMTISHDSHNIICIGDNDEDMMVAIKEIKDIGGGIVISSGGKVKESLGLEIGGLMSLNDGNFVKEKLAKLNDLIRRLGVNKEVKDPFLQLAFMSLTVVPEIKVTDKGLFDVGESKIIDLEVSEKSWTI